MSLGFGRVESGYDVELHLIGLKFPIRQIKLILTIDKAEGIGKVCFNMFRLSEPGDQ